MTSVSEKPILFSAPMVLAILDGRKTVTRRLVKPSKRGRVDLTDGGHPVYVSGAPDDGGEPIPCPYGAAGDRLWVRETWAAFTTPTHECGECDLIDGPPSEMRSTAQWVPNEDLVFRADGKSNPSRWRPGIHMPRWASRITLDVTDVRVERLQDITEEDARAEGVTLGELQPATINGAPGKVAIYDPVKAFAVLWDQVNGERAPWSSNPYVWVVEFRRLSP